MAVATIGRCAGMAVDGVRRPTTERVPPVLAERHLLEEEGHIGAVCTLRSRRRGVVTFLHAIPRRGETDRSAQAYARRSAGVEDGSGGCWDGKMMLTDRRARDLILLRESELGDVVVVEGPTLPRLAAPTLGDASDDVEVIIVGDN